MPWTGTIETSIGTLEVYTPFPPVTLDHLPANARHYVWDVGTFDSGEPDLRGSWRPVGSFGDVEPRA